MNRVRKTISFASQCGLALLMLGSSSAMVGSDSHPRPLPGRSFVSSPNFGPRPEGSTIDCIVVHATVIETLKGTVDRFLDLPHSVSAHYVVDRDGTTVQMVRDEDRAWHAGASELEGKKGVNDFSIGIEMVNRNDGVDPYPDAQYEAVARIIRHIRDSYDVPDTRIVSHQFIARPQGRKNDPKGFDFVRLKELASKTP
ncbi:MAG: N-acetylmuramoyl-L-alanine amidase [Chthonomonadales bacterium]